MRRSGESGGHTQWRNVRGATPANVRRTSCWDLAVSIMSISSSNAAASCRDLAAFPSKPARGMRRSAADKRSPLLFALLIGRLTTERLDDLIARLPDLLHCGVAAWNACLHSILAWECCCCFLLGTACGLHDCFGLMCINVFAHPIHCTEGCSSITLLVHLLVKLHCTKKLQSAFHLHSRFLYEHVNTKDHVGKLHGPPINPETKGHQKKQPGADQSKPLADAPTDEQEA